MESILKKFGIDFRALISRIVVTSTATFSSQ